jgi:phosphotransferase system  glucose/maltose/N-acetylglucosamine-specific IIC component
MIAVLALSNGLVAAIAVLVLAGLVVTLWAIIDAVSTPTSTFRDAGSSKALWITLISVLYFLTVYPGIIMAIVYLLFIRRRLRGSRAHPERLLRGR